MATKTLYFRDTATTGEVFVVVLDKIVSAHLYWKEHTYFVLLTMVRGEFTIAFGTREEAENLINDLTAKIQEVDNAT